KRTKGNIMADFWDDLRFAVRLLGKTPLFAVVVVLILALGVGANTAIFSLVDAVMLRSLPVRDSQELVLLSWAARKPPKFRSYSSYGDCGIPRAFRGANPHGCSFSRPFFLDLRAQQQVFSGMLAAAYTGRLLVMGEGPAAVAEGQLVSGDFF